MAESSFTGGMQSFAKTSVRLDSFPLFVLYLLMIAFSGIWQRYTKALALRPVLVVYNFICTAISTYTLFGFIYGLYQCESVYQRTPVPLLTHIFYWYHVTKRVEVLDTVFMVLRHRRRQISFLHVYHHASMLILSDYAANITPWPAIAPLFMLNSLVHVFLYFYYGLTAFNPSATPSWKPRLTELQIVQFYLDLVYAFYGYLYYGFCVYGFIYGVGMIYLFSSFYYHAYMKPKSKKPSSTKKESSEPPAEDPVNSVYQNGATIQREKAE